MVCTSCSAILVPLPLRPWCVLLRVAAAAGTPARAAARSPRRPRQHTPGRRRRQGSGSPEATTATLRIPRMAAVVPGRYTMR